VKEASFNHRRQSDHVTTLLRYYVKQWVVPDSWITRSCWCTRVLTWWFQQQLSPSEREREIKPCTLEHMHLSLLDDSLPTYSMALVCLVWTLRDNTCRYKNENVKQLLKDECLKTEMYRKQIIKLLKKSYGIEIVLTCLQRFLVSLNCFLICCFLQKWYEFHLKHILRLKDRLTEIYVIYVQYLPQLKI